MLRIAIPFKTIDIQCGGKGLPPSPYVITNLNRKGGSPFPPH